MLTRQNPVGWTGLDGSAAAMDAVTLPESPAKINIFEYTRALEAALVRWVLLAVFQCAALFYLALVGSKP